MILFRMVVKNKKRTKAGNGEGFKPRKMKINHPRVWFPEEYEQGKQWCMEQHMQHCFVRSHDAAFHICRRTVAECG